MGFKEKMMESMMGKMSAEEKSVMMDKMMDQFFGNMTTAEKQDMMKNMMPKMMGDRSGMSGMMEMMMGSTMSGNSDGEEGPMGMCEKMMNAMTRNSEMATFATPEIRGLFEEWIQQLDNEVLDFVKKTQSTNPDEVAAHLKISKDSAVYLLSRLAQKGMISFSIHYYGSSEKGAK